MTPKGGGSPACSLVKLSPADADAAVMSLNAHTAAWYADPQNPQQLRWWDGATWTDDVAPIEHAAPRSLRGFAARRSQQDVFPTARAEPIASAIDHRGAALAGLDFATAAKHLVVMAAGGAVAFLGAHMAGDLAAGAATSVFGLVLMAVGALLAAAPVMLWILRARKQFWNDYSSSRGFTTHGDLGLLRSPSVPLMRSGVGGTSDHLSLAKLGGHACMVGRRRYREMGDSLTTAVPFAFTFVAFALPEEVAVRFAGISVRERGFDSLASPTDLGNVVELESVDFARRSVVHTVSDQDPVALRELLGPQALMALSEHPVQWDQRGPFLVVFGRFQPTDAAIIDELCVSAVQVYEWYLGKADVVSPHSR